MAVWELTAFDTDGRYRDDVRYRAYTSSRREADLFNKIPRIQFTDSGHGIVFTARPHSGRRQPVRRGLQDYVQEEMAKLHVDNPRPIPTRNRPDYKGALRRIHAQLDRRQWDAGTAVAIAEIVRGLGDDWNIRPPIDEIETF